MNLNNVQLNTQQLADWYATALIETDATAMPQQAAPLFHALGGNAKNVLIVVAKKEQTFLPDAELHFLTNILSACGLSLADIALVNFEQTKEQPYEQLIAHFNSRHILLFDIEPLEFGLPINFPQFQVQAFNKNTYVWAPKLHLIENDKGLKKNLWNALKTVFGI